MSKVKTTMRYGKGERAAERELDAWLASINSPRFDALSALKNELSE
jgi:hypothetical protein